MLMHDIRSSEQLPINAEAFAAKEKVCTKIGDGTNVVEESDRDSFNSNLE